MRYRFVVDQYTFLVAIRAGSIEACLFTSAAGAKIHLIYREPVRNTWSSSGGACIVSRSGIAPGGLAACCVTCEAIGERLCAGIVNTKGG